MSLATLPSRPAQRVSRRHTLRLAGAGWAGAVLATGCSRADSQTEAAEFTLNWSYDPPPKGNFNFLGGVTGQITMGYVGDLFMLPGATYLRAEQQWLYLLADDSSNLSADGHTFTYVVRRGLRWSDGKPVTIQDVNSTWLLRWAGGHPVFDYVDSFEITGERTLTFHIGTPAPVSEYYLLRERIVPDAVYGQWAQRVDQRMQAGAAADDEEVAAALVEVNQFAPDSMVVTGPYIIDYDKVSNQSLVLRRNKRGYRAADVRFDRITVYNGEGDTAIQLALAGEIDYTSGGFPEATIRQLRKLGVRILRAPGWWGPALHLNFDSCPELADKRVRQALAHAIDRRQNATIVGSGARAVTYEAGICDDQVDTWLTPEEKAKLDRYPYDPGKAADLLRAAGWTKSGDTWRKPDGSPAAYDLLCVGEYPKYVTSASDLSGQLGEFGIKLTTINRDATQVAEDLQRGRFEIGYGFWGSSGNPSPSAAFAVAFIDNNYAGLAPDKGIDFELQQDTDIVGPIDLKQAQQDAGRGANDNAIRHNVSKVALAFNELLPILPLYENVGNNPVNTERIAGWPRDNDPIYQNSPYSNDNFVVILIFQGRLRPA